MTTSTSASPKKRKQIEALEDMILLVIRKSKGTLTDSEVIKRAQSYLTFTYTPEERAQAWDYAMGMEARNDGIY